MISSTFLRLTIRDSIPNNDIVERKWGKKSDENGRFSIPFEKARNVIDDYTICPNNKNLQHIKVIQFELETDETDFMIQCPEKNGTRMIMIVDIDYITLKRKKVIVTKREEENKEEETINIKMRLTLIFK